MNKVFQSPFMWVAFIWSVIAAVLFLLVYSPIIFGVALVISGFSALSLFLYFVAREDLEYRKRYKEWPFSKEEDE